MKTTNPYATPKATKAAKATATASNVVRSTDATQGPGLDRQGDPKKK